MSNIERQQHPSHFVTSQTIREKFRRYRLWRLRTLPAHVYRELIDRLHRGHACFSLAKWVLKLPDRGGMQNVGFCTIWKDIQVLAEEINAKRADSPRSIESLIPQPSGEKSQAEDQRNSPLPGSPKKLGRVEDHASEDAKSPSRTVVLQSLFDHNWEALEHCGVREEDLLEKGLPVLAPMYARLRLITKQLKILIELRRNEAEEELKQKAVERSTAQLPQEKRDAEDKVENPLPNGPNKRSVEDHVPEGLKKLDRRVELQKLFEHNWEALERCRIIEEDLAEKDLPPHRLIPARVQLTKKQLKIVIELRRNEAQELLKQKAVGRFTAQASQQKSDVEDQPENPLPDDPNKRPVDPERVKKLDRKVMLQALFVHNWDALECCRVIEEELVDNGLPVHALVMHATVRLIAVQGGILTEWGRNDVQEFVKQKVIGSKGFPPQPLSDSAKQELKQMLQKFSPEDRRVLRQILDRG